MRIAIIPARGGSVRIPKKNIKNFCGKPIIEWSIEAAIASKVFDRIIVSTDSVEIAEISTKCGAEVPFIRPSELSDNIVMPGKVMQHAVSWLIDSGVRPEAVCCIFATSPFIAPGDISKGLNELLNNSWEYVFIATDYEYSIYRGFRFDDKNRVRMLYPDHYLSRSQDLPVVLHDAGQFYWGKPSAWLENIPVLTNNSTAIVIPRWRVQDIDNHDDWMRAEKMFMILNQ